MNIIQIWKDLVAQKLSKTNGFKFTFKTTLQSKTSDVAVYHEHDGTEVEVKVWVADTIGQVDEECLPILDGHFNDGVVLSIYPEELVSTDAHLNDVLSVVNKGWALARDLGYAGPYHLSESGSDAEKAKFAQMLTEVAST